MLTSQKKPQRRSKLLDFTEKALYVFVMGFIQPTFTLNATGVPTLQQTVELIDWLHEGQTDLNHVPYAYHPRRVAGNISRLVRGLAFDEQLIEDTLRGGLLHDTVEDCKDKGASYAMLAQYGFTPETLEIVRIVTKDGHEHLPYDELISYVIDTQNLGAIIVKLADNLDNLHPVRRQSFFERRPERSMELTARYQVAYPRLAEAAGIPLSRCEEILSKPQTISLMR